MASSSIQSTKTAVLSAVPEDGTAIGNKRLRESLNLSVRDYQVAVDELVDEGVIERWRGRGGTVRRTSAVATQPKPRTLPADVEKIESEVATRTRVLEAKLYPPFLESLRLWANEQGWTQYVVNQVANQGGKKTGGAWTRPDFVVIGHRKFEYTPGIVRDVETFEVKPSNCGIDAVFETASHSRVSTKSFLAIHQTNDGPDEDLLGRIEAECVRFGIGLIVFSDPKDYANWEYKVEPMRTEPDPFDLEEFIRIQIPATDQERIRKWLR